MRAQAEPTPQPSDDSLQSVLNNLIDFYEEEPWLVVLTSIITALAVGGMLAGIVYAISKAGHFQPPRVVLSVITGLVAMLAIIAVMVRPGVEALGVAVGAAIGSLGTALANAYSEEMRAERGDGPCPPDGGSPAEGDGDEAP